MKKRKKSITVPVIMQMEAKLPVLQKPEEVMGWR